MGAAEHAPCRAQEAALPHFRRHSAMEIKRNFGRRWPHSGAIPVAAVHAKGFLPGKAAEVQKAFGVWWICPSLKDREGRELYSARLRSPWVRRLGFLCLPAAGNTFRFAAPR